MTIVDAAWMIHFVASRTPNKKNKRKSL